jgi:hypothetical protein
MSSNTPLPRMPVRKPTSWLSPGQKCIFNIILKSAIVGAIVGAYRFTAHGNAYDFPLTTLKGMVEGALIGATWPLWVPFVLFVTIN